MDRRIKLTLWVFLVLSLIAISSGFSIRVSNESINKSIVPVADFDEFFNAARISGIDFETILLELKNSGVKTIAVKAPYSMLSHYPNTFNMLRSKGFDILLRPVSYADSNSRYIYGLERLVSTFNIKYIIFDGYQVVGNPYHLTATEELLKKHAIITGIIETPSQVGYVDQQGLETLIPATGYSINRTYIISDKDLLHINGNDMFYRWLRCVVDRGIRFIYIRPLKSQNSGDFQRLTDTLETVRNFNKFISLKGYSVDTPIVKLSAKTPVSFYNVLVFVSLFFGVLLYWYYLFNPRLISLSAAAIIGIIGVFAVIQVNTYHTSELTHILAISSAVFYPSFSGLLVLKYLKSSTENTFIVRLISSLAIILAVNAAGMYTVVTTQADIRYTMNILVFDGVIQAYTIPVVAFIINYFLVFKGYKEIKNTFIGFKNHNLKWSYTLLLAAAAFVFYIYISRSGNNSLIPPSFIELELRKLLERWLLVRPRFKEFLIGYPSLFLFVYLTSKSVSSKFLLPLGIGITIGSISMVNSFCHVFTSIEVSALRTFYGLAIGTVLGGLALSAAHILLRLKDKY
ncbi:MAG: DUF5693 family protein [Clostridia bacterium]|nr:DUF5693 family protein [Clostridia bacterium]